jgi:murein L,D-transpeptidase YcbB/YkuD
MAVSTPLKSDSFPRGVQPTSVPEQRIDLPRPVPIYMTYLTVAPSQNGVVFREDRYGFDAQAMPQMFGPETRVASSG